MFHFTTFNPLAAASHNAQPLGSRIAVDFFLIFALLFFVLSAATPAQAAFVIHSETALNLELIGYNGLSESSIFTGTLTAGSKQQIETNYQGLALLVLPEGQRYPLLIGDASFTLTITDPATQPLFIGSDENNALYRALSGKGEISEQYEFPFLMLQAKKLIKSSHSIKTIQELMAKRKEFQVFVITHYQQLQHSDMVRQLIGQYFMMHEYVSYRVKTSAGIKYKDAVLSGVGAWIELLHPFIAKQKILNYCVSLYYNRSMVTLSFQIMENFPDLAWCSGQEKEVFNFPAKLTVVDAAGTTERTLDKFQGDKLIAFVSDDCPVSMAATVIKARQLADQNNGTILLVAPLQPLSSNHLLMNRMVSNGNIFFINDEKWRTDNLSQKIKLPLFLKVPGNVGQLRHTFDDFEAALDTAINENKEVLNFL